MGADIEHLGSSEYRHDQEFGIDWGPALKETSLVCHSAPTQEGLRTSSATFSCRLGWH